MGFKDAKILGVRQVRLFFHKDRRGLLVETFRSDRLQIKPAMSYVSYTRPGESRGPHEHRRQADVFSFIGPGNFKVALWDNRKSSKTYMNRVVVEAGKKNPLTLVVPPGVAHGYKNNSGEPGMVINYSDKLYRGRGKRGKVDQIRHEDSRDGFYEDFLKL